MCPSVRDVRLLLGVTCLLVVACSSPESELLPLQPLATAAAPAAEPCRRSDTPAVGEGTGLLIGSIERARVDDDRCGPPPGSERLCRALWVAARTDPIVALVTGAENQEFAALLDHHRWSLEEGLAVAEGEVAIAFGFLAGSIDEFDQLVTSDVAVVDERGLRRWVIERGAPMIVEPLAAAEEVCLLGAENDPGVVAEANDEEPGP